MRQKLTRWKKVGLAFSTGLILATGILMPLYTGTARADGESYFFDNQSGTITMSGGLVIDKAVFNQVGYVGNCDHMGSGADFGDHCFSAFVSLPGIRTRDRPSGDYPNIASCVYEARILIVDTDLNSNGRAAFAGQDAIRVRLSISLLDPSDGPGDRIGDCQDDASGLIFSPGTIPILSAADIAAQKTCTDQGGAYDTGAKKCTLPTCPPVGGVQGIYSTADKNCAYPASSFPNGTCPQGLTLKGTSCVGSATPPASDTSNGEEPDVCPVEKTTPLRWFACPVVSAGEVITNVLDATINYFLTIDTTQMFGTATGANGNIGDPAGGQSAGFYKAWSTFRNLGIALVVISGLIMVMSEMLGLGIVDAYTIRKTLPRLVVAIIGISISWFLSFYLITFFNKLGHGIASLIYSAFSGLPQGGTGSGGAQTISIFAQYFAVGAGLAALGVLGILSFLGTIILALLVGIAVLILREAIVIMCVIIGPLAIAAYTLPNTAKFAKFWWDTFIKALMAFPIITGFIAICKVMAVITGQIGTN